jgi:hypothetical protein
VNIFLSSGRNSVERTPSKSVERTPSKDPNSKKKTNIKNVNCRGRQQKLIKNIFSRDSKGWYENREICDACFDFPKATLKTKFGPTPIFIYPKNEDVWVSTSLQDKGTFESEKSEIIFKMLKDDPELQFVDIGANVGKYGLLDLFSVLRLA